MPGEATRSFLGKCYTDGMQIGEAVLFAVALLMIAVLFIAPDDGDK